MANTQGVLKESIWRDKDFRALTRSAQATYSQLISQKDLDRAGMQPLMVSRWARGCDDISESDVWRDLNLLEVRRFVFVDEDTDELFVRSYMRTCEITKYPNILTNALRCARLVASEKIRHELAIELRRLRRGEATKVADEIDPVEPLPNPSETNSNGSQTVPEGLKGSETVLEPPGTGKGTGIGSVPEIEGFRAQPPTTVTTAPDREPPSKCFKHRLDPNPPPCGPCAGFRHEHDEWIARRKQRDSAARSAEVRAAADVRAQAIANCDLCDEDGYRGTTLCDHDPDLVDRAARGMAGVRAAMSRPVRDA